ncbi:histidine phosphatase family protein [Robiginitalea sp. SC105]|uniref:SixA phosphatase family protein n=1 Tax=Robiginitalea sp. SC105 TaxID=2762332 RepID=UPI00163A13D3|nr:phosphoglycerate mutase family protein [Robiginitalea sp. SC105]MBC2840747.1 histidine phosphatase family protein [Robiginitalea sp. SC105]
MKINNCLILLCILFLGLSCKDDAPLQDLDPGPAEVTTFYLIRHAEKDRSNPEDIDPELTQKGLGRAMHWAEILNDVPLDAIYTTDFERTSMTAAPAAVKQDITVQYYDPQTLDVEAFKTENRGGNVLVVGHSNTTPELVNRLLGETRYPAMDDSDNGSLFIVQLVGSRATATRLIFNCNCPD